MHQLLTNKPILLPMLSTSHNEKFYYFSACNFTTFLAKY